MALNERFYPEYEAGGFTRVDGTIQFYTRVNALLRPDMVVIDLGAGRGCKAEELENDFTLQLTQLKGKVAKVIGIDVDEAVRENPMVDEAIVYDGKALPLPDHSVDLILSDAVFEHIDDPALFASEIDRVLKPGGWVCALTPHLFSALVVAASIVPNRHHKKALQSIQPDRKPEDVFPTRYKLNSANALQRYFPKARWRHHSYTWSPEPSYHFENPLIYRLFMVYHYVKRPLLGGESLNVFLRKHYADAAQ